MITEMVDIAPLALLNAFRFNYGEMEECSLLVDIGARTTNLVFIEPGLVFSRSVRSGGNSVTQAVAREFNEPFQAAEERKRRDGFVNLGGAYEDPSDADVAALSKVIRNSMTKLHAEISRSIGFYRAQQKGSRPARIYLAGAGSNLPYMQEFFSEKFQLPVELFNPLRNVTLSSDMRNHPVLQNAHTIGELVGLALRDLGDCPMEINLQPATVAARKEAGSRRPFFIFAALALIAALAIWWVYLIQAQEVAAQKLDERTAQVSELQPMKRSIDEAEDRLAELQQIADPLINVSLEREYWTGMLEDLHQNIPKRGIWITNIEPMFETAVLPVGSPTDLNQIIQDPSRAFGRQRDRGDSPVPDQVVVDKIAVQGLVLENAGRAIVYEFVANLINSDYFAITQENVNAPEIFQETPSPDGTQFAYSFMLELPLKKTLTVE
jgi:type IV pilus assembly protein PilM